MGKGSPAPTQPDPVVTANAQGEVNADAARLQRTLNQVNVASPYGGVTYSQDGDQSTANITLSPDQQALLDQQNRLGLQTGDIAGQQLDRVGSSLAAPLDPNSLPRIDQTSVNTAGMPAIQSGPNAPTLQGSVGNPSVQSGLDFSGLPQLSQGSVAERDAYSQALTARAQPDLEKARTQEQTRLLNSGIREGSQAWADSMQGFDRQQVDLSNQAALAAGQEQSRIAGLNLANRGQMANETTTSGQFANQATGQQFGQNLAAGQFGNDAASQQFGLGQSAATASNAARAQGFNEQAATIQQQSDARNRALSESLALRNQPLNEIGALSSGGQVQLPTLFQPSATSVSPANLQGQINQNYQNELDAYNRSQSSRQQTLGSLYGLGGSIISSFI